MKDHNCVADESGLCFECNRPVLRVVGEPALPEWLQWLADTCPAEDFEQLKETIESGKSINK